MPPLPIHADALDGDQPPIPSGESATRVRGRRHGADWRVEVPPRLAPERRVAGTGRGNYPPPIPPIPSGESATRVRGRRHGADWRVEVPPRLAPERRVAGTGRGNYPPPIPSGRQASRPGGCGGGRDAEPSCLRSTNHRTASQVQRSIGESRNPIQRLLNRKRFYAAAHEGYEVDFVRRRRRCGCGPQDATEIHDGQRQRILRSCSTGLSACQASCWTIEVSQCAMAWPAS